MKEEFSINFYNDDHTLKDKKQFIEEVEKIYDQHSKPADTFPNSFSYLDYLISEENRINTKATYETFNFLSRFFYINDEITTEVANNFHQFINFWNEVENIDQTPVEEVMPLQLYINSEGGDLDAALSIISAMQASRIPVNTHVYGKSWSGAFFISICGKYRTAGKYSSFLFHEGNALFGENAHKFIQFSNFYKNTLEQVRYITTHNTNISEADYQLHKNDDWWMTAEEALKYGIIDKIESEVITNEVKE